MFPDQGVFNMNAILAILGILGMYTYKYCY